uniref:Cnidarian restricted protein n=1 Tax=Clytia hemisphaerica TaxID=252671 RepID=A0A7M5V6U9_9CNID|eukprot:TCONS_00030764-protein
MRRITAVLFVVGLLVLGTEAQKPKTKQGKRKKVALPRCPKNVTCDWSESKINYRIEKAKAGKKKLYHVETRALAYDSGSVRFNLTPAYRKYFTRTSFTNPEIVRQILGQRVQDSKAPIVLDGKVTKRATFDDVHTDPASQYTIFFSQHQEFNGEYTCSSRGEDVLQTICRINVYLTDYKVPYYVAAKNGEKNCRCFIRGMYEIRNYAQVEFKVEEQRREYTG